MRSVYNLAAGRNTFTFQGHDWLALYPQTYQQHGITDVGALVDVDMHNINDSATEAVVGHWRNRDDNRNVTTRVRDRL